MTRVPYVELRAHTAFSFGDGAVSPEDLVIRAVQLGYPAIGITDTADMGGLVRAQLEALRQGDRRITVIAGAELRVAGQPMAFLARNAEGCRNLAALVTLSRVGELAHWTRERPGRPRGAPNVTWEQVRSHATGLHLLTGPASGTIAAHVRSGEARQAQRLLHEWRESFHGCLAVEVQQHKTGGDERALAGALIELAERAQVPWVAVQNPRYIDDDGRLVHDILTALRGGTTLDDAAARGLLHPNSEWCLPVPDAMRRAWAGLEQGLEESVRIASECHFDLRWFRPPLPKFVDNEEDEDLVLRHRVYDGARVRWGDVLTSEQTKQIEYELEIIANLGFAGFFLVMWDAVRSARKERILCQGRGSAANSAVAYCLEITAVDPVKHGLLFERFLSEVRVSDENAADRYVYDLDELDYAQAPDIDVDVENRRREEVFEYMYNKYAREKSGIVCIVQTYGVPNAILDSMRALGYSAEQARFFSKRLHRYADFQESIDVLQKELAPRQRFPLDNPRGRALITAIRALDGLPRLRSTHVGGFALSSKPIGNYLPVEHTTMGRTIIQFDKDDLDAIGVPKFDFLGLGALTLVRHAFEAVKRHTGTELTLYNLPYEDKETYAMIARGDTLGTFQIESRAQIASILRTQPDVMYDIVVQIALVRPGPIQGDFVDPYTRRRRGDQTYTPIHPALEEILDRTYGIPIFQEQAMAIAATMGGFSHAEADQLRRSMGNIKKTGKLKAVLDKLEAKMIANETLDPRVTPEVATRIGQELITFANYGFPESHAWSFALIAFATAYLKRHYPAFFYLGILNAYPMGFYQPSTLIHDARRAGVEVHPPCLHAGDRLCTIIPGIHSAPHALRIGWQHIQGLSTKTLDRIDHCKSCAPFTSIADVVQRIPLSRSEALQFARANAFAAWEPDRRKAAWEALRAASDIFPFAPSHEITYDPRTLDDRELIFLDYQATGICVTGHPMEHRRKEMRAKHILDSQQLAHAKDGTSVVLAGLVTVRQRPSTANGTIFLLIEDEFGFMNVIVFPPLVKKYHDLVKYAPFLIVQGQFQREGPVMNVIAHRFAELKITQSLAHQVHNFH